MVIYHEDSEKLDALREGNLKVMEELYANHRQAFFKWGHSRFHGKQEDLEDIWQDTVIIFFEQVKNGQLLKLNHSLRTYLFAIAKHKLLNHHRTQERVYYVNLQTDLLDAGILSVEEEEAEWQFNVNIVTENMERLSESCRDLLIRRYYLGQSIEIIKVSLEMKNNNVASASLSRCLNQLKTWINQKKS